MGCGTITAKQAEECSEKPTSLLEPEPPTEHRKHSSKATVDLFVVEEEPALLEQSASQSRLSLAPAHEFAQIYLNPPDSSLVN